MYVSFKVAAWDLLADLLGGSLAQWLTSNKLCMLRIMAAPIVDIQSCLGRTSTEAGYTVIDKVCVIN